MKVNKDNFFDENLNTHNMRINICVNYDVNTRI
jgi:hypothetical protein